MADFNPLEPASEAARSPRPSSAEIVALLNGLGQRGLPDNPQSSRSLQSFTYALPDSDLVVNRTAVQGVLNTLTVKDSETVLFNLHESGRITEDRLTLDDISTLQAALQAAQQPTVVEAQVVPEPEVKIKGFASVRDSYVDRYGDNAATVATVVALAQRGELFDRDTADNAIVEAYFYRVPNSTLIVNRVDTNDQYGDSRTFTVLDEDEPLFQIGDSGQLEFNHLTLAQVESLQTAQRDGASPLLVSESYFQIEVAQALTHDGEAQARTLLSQGDLITPDTVTALNDLMAAEEDLRRLDQAERGFSGTVRYPRFTEYELNHNLSTDAIAFQLSAQSPVVEARVVAEAQSQQPVTMPSVADYLESVTPETLGAMVYSQYYQWVEQDGPEPVFELNGYRVDIPSYQSLAWEERPLPVLVVDRSTDRVVFDFTIAQALDGDTLVAVNSLDESLKPQLVEAFEDVHRKAGLVASTYLNRTEHNNYSLYGTSLIFQREYDPSVDDGPIQRDLVYSRDATASDGSMYAIAQVRRDGNGMELGMPASVEREIKQEFSKLVTEYEKELQFVAKPLEAPSIDQGRSQVEVQKPPVAGYESSYESEATNPHLQQEANVMVAVQEAPVQAQTEIDLRDLMSVKTLSIMETGKVPQQRVELEGKPQLVDRSPQEGLAMVARAAYGAKNFCEEHNLPHQSHLDIITTAADRLSLNGPEVAAVLDSIDKEKCRPVMEVATKSQDGVWSRIEEKYPEYADRVPGEIKVSRAQAGELAAAKAVVDQATTRQVATPVLKQREAVAQLPSQFEMAVTVAAYNLQKAGVDRMGHDNDRAKVIFNRSKDGNITVINKTDNVVVASRNGVTGQVIPGVLPEGQDYTQAFAAVVQKQTEKYTSKAAAAAPKAKAKAGDGR